MATVAAVPAPVLTTGLFERFFSRGEADLEDELFSAMQYGFGGHQKKVPESEPASALLGSGHIECVRSRLRLG